MTRAQGLRSSRRKPATSSQDTIPEYCKENSPSILSQNASRRAAQVKTRSNDGKENVLPKSSKRKPLKSSQDIREYCKENSPSILSQNSRKIAQSKEKFNDYKENILPAVFKKNPVKSNKDIIPEYNKENSPSVVRQNPKRGFQAEKKFDNCKENISPKGLSGISRLNPVTTTQECYSPIRKSSRHPNGTKPRKTNTTQPERNVLNDTTNSLHAVLNRNNVFRKIITVPQPSTSTINNNHENHIPVYNTTSPLKPSNSVEQIAEKKATVYEFEVDENEEPVVKKKRKKRAYVRKPKTGPKALTINNIKYSSTESLASLPEKPIGKKKNTFVRPKCNVTASSSVAALSDSCVSVPSFVSHPALAPRDNRCELSVLQETQSEQCLTPEPPHSSSAAPLALSHSHHVHFSPNPRCYGSKTPNPYNDVHNSTNDFPLQPASSNATIGSTSSHDFLSSTPCKRFSLVVRDNSVFDDTPGMRSGTGLAQDASSLAVTDDNCFGFDEPEELEEPLVSPIKNEIDLKPRKVLKCAPKINDWDEPYKPSIQEVIEMLKANVPKPTAKKETTMFVTSPQSSERVSPTVEDIDSPVFVKPARRSYERQRRVQYYKSDSEEEEEIIEEIKNDTTITKEDKKCYKKANTTKAPKISKAKQRIAKEEEELEKMAAMMNAQFQEIDKVDLVVE